MAHKQWRLLNQDSIRAGEQRLQRQVPQLVIRHDLEIRGEMLLDKQRPPKKISNRQ
jgi:hypothetical protein